MLRLNLIGPGRVGLSLTRLWQRAGQVQLHGVHARSPEHRAQALRLLGPALDCATLAELPPADLWLLAVPDTQIGPVAQQLAAHWARSAVPTPPPQAWHCSGFLPAAELAPLQALGWAVASVHPCLSFTDPDTATAQFPGTVCALEGDAAARARAEPLLTALGARCFTLAAADKPRYHAAAVFASNFPPVLQAVAAELWQGTGVPPDWVDELARGFLQRAAANLARLPPQQALTGPAARGDQRVLREQSAALHAQNPALGQAYDALSELAGRLARNGRSLG